MKHSSTFLSLASGLLFARIGIAQGPCVPTQLTTTPDPVISCGATGLLLDGSNMICADSVPLAKLYQWHFVNVPGQPSYVRNIAFETRCFTLKKWSLNPLKHGRTYQVTVRVSFDDGTTWCPFGPSCMITLGYPMEAPLERGASAEGAVVDRTSLEPFPNPSADGGFTVALPVELTDEPARLELIDQMGRVSEDLPVNLSPGMSELRVQATGRLAGGLYVVRLTQGSAVWQGRLVVE
jgi:hypothetical protein